MKQTKEPKRTRYAPDGAVVPLEDDTAGAAVLVRLEPPGRPLPLRPRSGRGLVLAETEAVERSLEDLKRWGDETYAAEKKTDAPSGPLSQWALAHGVRIDAMRALHALERVEAISPEAMRAARYAVACAIAAQDGYRIALFQKGNAPEVLAKRKANRDQETAAAKGGAGKGIAARKLRIEAVRLAAEWSVAHPLTRSRLHVARNIAPKLGRKAETVDGWLHREAWHPGISFDDAAGIVETSENAAGMVETITADPCKSS